MCASHRRHRRVVLIGDGCDNGCASRLLVSLTAAILLIIIEVVAADNVAEANALADFFSALNNGGYAGEHDFDYETHINPWIKARG